MIRPADADRQLEGLSAGAADPRQVQVEDTDPIIRIAVADVVQHAFDDVDVMLSAIQAAHAVCWCTCNADRVLLRRVGVRLRARFGGTREG